MVFTYAGSEEQFNGEEIEDAMVFNDGPARGNRFLLIGTDGKILHIDKRVKADTHGADCAAKLAELGVAKAE